MFIYSNINSYIYIHIYTYIYISTYIHTYTVFRRKNIYFIIFRRNISDVELNIHLFTFHIFSTEYTKKLTEIFHKCFS